MGQNLPPDDVVLSTIFPNSKPASTQILAANWEVCTFKAHFDVVYAGSLPEDVIVRMETSSGKLEAVSRLQSMAHDLIHNLVPETHAVGKACTADGKQIEYSITMFVADAFTLESVWPSLDATQQESLVDAIITVIAKIQQAVVPSDSLPKVANMRDLLTDSIAQHQLPSTPTSSISDSAEGITITSALPSLGSVFLSNHDLQALDNDSVLCHNDMEPRNILVRRSDSDTYTLAAIIDWEMAGFFPFAFETARKDVSLRSNNLHFDWYALYKAKTQGLIAPGAHSVKLIEAVHLIVNSRALQFTHNVGTEFCRRWMEKEGLVISSDIVRGFVKKVGAKAWEFTADENNEMEVQVLRDVGYIS